MDEIVIEDKKYISTKKAAKVTGYAKDYVGQLCREGRVPARLVGRSWYVLESALADHRFGNEVEHATAEKSEEEESKFPKYQADEIEEIEMLSSERVMTREEEKDEKRPERDAIADAWEAWFDRVAKATGQPKEEEVVADEEEEAETDEEVHISREEHVVIRAVETKERAQESDEGSQKPQKKSVQVPRSHVQAEKKERPSTPRAHTSSIIVSTKIGGGFVALFFLVAFALSTGIFDTIFISSGQDTYLAGISIYNK